MPSLPDWSSTSGSCRPEVFRWRPSRQQGCTTALLAAAAVAALLLSGLPPATAIPAAIALLARAIAVLRREACRDAVLVELSADTVSVDGAEVASLSVAWRGPLAFMRWREPSGRTRRLVWWPDVLSTEARRRLRLATGRESSSPLVASVAP